MTDLSTGVDALFEHEPTPIRPGDTVRAQTIWGYEPCEVVEVGRDRSGYPIATLRGSRGDTFTISIARVRREETP